MVSRTTRDAARPPFLFVGNHPALDFLNTAPLVDDVPSERLTDYAALVELAVEAELLLPEDAAFARRAWAGTDAAMATVVRVRSLRELVRKVVMQIARRAPPSPGHLASLNAWLREDAGVYPELRKTETGFERRVRLRRGGPDDLVAPIVGAISALLTEADLSLVRKCESPSCALFFLDTSKNHRRRWCSMELCGNRNKVGAYRARTAKTEGR